MSESIVQKLDCNNEKTVQYGFDMACQEITVWQVPFGSTLIPGRCPQCEQDRLYPGMHLSYINVLDWKCLVHVLI